VTTRPVFHAGLPRRTKRVGRAIEVWRRRWACLCIESNGRGTLERSAERSRGSGNLEAMGNDSASSAQSKRGVGLNTDGGVGVGCRSGGSAISSCKSAEREPWNSSWGCFVGSGRARCRSGAAGGSPESGRAGDAAVVDDDMAVVRRGSRCGLGVWGTSWGEPGAAGGLLGLRLKFWGERVRFVEQTTRSNKRVCTSSCNSVCWATDRRGTLVTAWLAVSEVVRADWVLTAALAVISKVVVAGVAAAVGGDVAVVQGCSRHEKRGWEIFCGAVNRLGRVCRRFRGVGSCAEAMEAVVVAVVDNVGVVDGGCAGVVGGDVAGLTVEGGLVTRAVVSFSVWEVASVVFVVVCILKSMRSAIRAFFGELGLSSSSGSV
jgi:hypothetical protein